MYRACLLNHDDLWIGSHRQLHSRKNELLLRTGLAVVHRIMHSGAARCAALLGPLQAYVFRIYSESGETSESSPDFGVHEQIDLYELYKIHHSIVFS